MNLSADAIDRLLPQTQCGQCGYGGCKPYAEAIASGAADIDRCPPGGDEGALQLAALTGLTIKPVDRSLGPVYETLALAWIDEPRCIGCTRCIQVCPVDAIVGAAKLMHTVIATHCTGCELCLPACPVDCIVMEPQAAEPRPALMVMADASRQRYRQREVRLERLRREQDEVRRQARAAKTSAAADDPVAVALARLRGG